MSTTYMTAKLNLADGTILYPQISLDNIVASISAIPSTEHTVICVREDTFAPTAPPTGKPATSMTTARRGARMVS